jgi:hypothetical protein
MAERLKIRPHPGWRAVANPNGPATYVSTSGSALQFSFANYLRGKLPNITEESLIGLCEKLTLQIRGRRVVSSRSGTCDFGLYGTVAVRGEEPVHTQAWVLSNRQEFILITYTCATEPESREVFEANQIALMTRCAEAEEAKTN